MLRRHFIFLSIVFAGAVCWGQTPQGPDDPISDQLFPPELVMQYSQEISLTADQSKAVREELQKAQARFVDMQWDMQAEKEKLVLLLKARPIDEIAALAQVDKVLDREREIKRAQISLLVRIKNQLSVAQQNKLIELRRKPS